MKKNNNSVKLFVILVTTNEKHFLTECLDSLLNQIDINFSILMVDNNSTDGSIKLVQNNYPQVIIHQLSYNAGYAAANNIGLTKSFSLGAECCILLNTDTICDKNALSSLMKTYSRLLKSNKNKVGLIQPVILVNDDRSLINTIGNATHYLGFGYCKDYKKPLKDSSYKNDPQIQSVSGAALFISRKYFNEVGKLDEDFFIYNEDQNYSWRGLLLGYSHYLSSKALVYHKYNFHRRPFKMYHSEKNRISMLLENYEKRTLLMLLPIFIVIELALICHSILNGWFSSKIRSYISIIKKLPITLEKRKVIQYVRIVQDKKLIVTFDSTLSSVIFDNVIIRKIINPLLSNYYQLLIRKI